MPRFFIALSFLVFQTTLYAQPYDFMSAWENLGPEEKPLEDRKSSATGIGPLEFIKACKTKEGLLLAGSLNGGLFYSENGGEQWINAGSDEWEYSGSGWADFHPKDEKIWFATSCMINNNGQPGLMGDKGGIFRTKDAGLNWELVADKTSFNGSPYLVVYGFVFHPDDANRLIVYTDEGLYSTSDCTAPKIEWKRITDLAGWIYDVQFTKNHVFISHMQFGKWHTYVAPRSSPDRYKKVEFIEKMNDPIVGITFQPYKDDILILVNFTRKGDHLFKYDQLKDKEEVVLRTQRVLFGTGRTFAVSPHNPEEAIIGYSTTMKRWNIATKKNEPRMKGGYHVDIEYVEYDPFDSMKIYLGTHGGVYTSFDNGESWLPTSKGFGIAEVECIAVSPIDPNQIAIGCYHDGSTVRADWEGNGTYQWKNVNGGDGLKPLMADYDKRVLYTSNQYTGGGLYVSYDKGKTNVNIHNKKRIGTPGWQMAAVLNPADNKQLFFNYTIREPEGKGNVDILRTSNPTDPDSHDRISNFMKSHNIPQYSVYGIYNSEYYPNSLFIHLIVSRKNEDGTPYFEHRMFKNDHITDSVDIVLSSWVELEIPRSDWIGSIYPDPKKSNKIYLAYVGGLDGEEKGLIYSLEFKRDSILKREKDISRNLPLSLTGRYNIAYDGNGGMFFGTRLGVFYGDKRTLKGKRDWRQIGFGLPHCKVHGLHFDPKENSLTVGLYGRGVWKYYL